MEYIKATSSQKQLNDLDIEFLRNWSKNSHWQHLEIVSNNESDDKGFVEFKAYYIYDNIQRCHHEKSYFIKIDSKWYYDAGELVEDNFKIGRNDPCICQSNNKYKKCCGKLIK
jgi:SEC-C motif-containing protein